MAELHEIVRFADGLLDAGAFDDYGPNGLQVEGRPEVRRVATGVSAHLELFEGAAAAGADLVLCHHGLFWGGDPHPLTGVHGARVRALVEAELSLAAYHLPLDAHAEIGNNALLCELLGLERTEPFGEHRGRAIGWVGRSAEGIEAGELVRRVRDGLGREPLVFDAGPAVVHSVGIVSGGASGDLGVAARLGLDAFLTGEPSEPAMATARDSGVHFIAAGHYATETLGIRRLGELVAERFGVEHAFIDVPNPV